MNATAKLIGASSAGVLVLTLFLGWRGSKLAEQEQLREIHQSLETELGLAEEVVSSRLVQLETEMFNIISAEYLQHTSHASGVSTELNDSGVLAVGVLELKASGYEPSWWSINPKSRDSVSTELLQSLMPEWRASIQQMNRRYFFRAVDLKQSPMMVFFSRIELPNVESASIAVAVLPPTALKLNSRSLPDSFLWDQKGFIWGYQNPSYIGASLKTDPLVRRSLRTEEDTSQPQFVPAREQTGVFASLPETNLYVGLHREMPSLADILARWWSSILLALMGAVAVSIATVRWWRDEADELMLPAIVERSIAEPAAGFATDPEDVIDPEPTTENPLHAESGDEPIDKDVSAPANESKDTVSIEAVLRKALAAYRQRCGDEGVQVEEYFAEGIHVTAKPAQLQTALEEIIKNALDAMKESSEKRLRVETAVEASSARITIIDTGSGIAPVDKEKIFEPFFTTKSDASRGLGLTVVKRLLELVKGEARVESEPGKSTRMTLLIPLPGTLVEKTVVPPSALPQSQLSESLDFLENEELSELQPMRMEHLRDIAKKVEIRKPKVRMFD